MKNRILEFLNKREAVLWVKTYDYHEIEKIFFENNESLENKKVYVYDKESDSPEPMMKNLYTTLDSLYPEGIRKIPVILLIKDSIEEILENKNLEYIKEIAETKRDNPKYNLTIIIVNNKKIPSQLATFCKYIKKSDLKNENNIKNYIIELAAAKKISLTQKEVENILNLLIEDIEEINKKRNDKQQIENNFSEAPIYKKKSIKIKDMVLVKGGKYKPSFLKEEKETFDIEVCKYQVTQAMWEEIMGSNPSTFKGESKPVNMISWWGAVEYCNKLSEKYGLIPVYNIDKKRGILTINQIDGEISFPDKADFSKTEGFRLPTEIEWEWFAIGGKLANKDEKILDANKMEEEAWYYKNSGGRTNNVGFKKPNQLGIYDCIGNVCEWCYDTTEGDIESGKLYVYTALDSRKKYREIRGGSWKNGENTCTLFFRDYCDTFYADSTIGFRIVRTVLI